MSTCEVLSRTQSVVLVFNQCKALEMGFDYLKIISNYCKWNSFDI